MLSKFINFGYFTSTPGHTGENIFFRHNLKLLFLFISLTSSLFLISCDTAVEPIIPEKKLDTLYSSNHFLWPLKKGNYWDYKGYEFQHVILDSNWTFDGFNSFGFSLDTVNHSTNFRLEIVDSLLLNINDTVYACHVLDSYDFEKNKYQDFKAPYWVGDDGIYSMGIYGERGDTVLQKGIYIPHDIKRNSVWKGQMAYKQYGVFHANEVLSRVCLSENDIINTPAGTFECYVIKTRIRQAEDVYGYYDYYKYYAPGIGLICNIRFSVIPTSLKTDKILLMELNYISIIDNIHIN